MGFQKKGIKVKRYNRIYRDRQSPGKMLFKGIGVLLVVCVLGFVGWNSYEPVMNYLSGALKAQSQAASSSGTEASGDAQAPGDADEPGQGADSEAAAPAPAVPAAFKAIYLPLSVITDNTQLESFLAELDKTDFNAVLFDLKDVSGNLLYRSELELVKQAGSQVAGAYDLKALCSHLESYNMIPIGRLQAFRDPVAASEIPDAAVKYMNSEMLWLDDAPDKGGKPWLNPYSDLARAYISDIASEAVSMGVRQVLLDNVSFPASYGLEYATYGVNASKQTREEALSSFVEQVEQQVASLGGEVSVYITARAALGADNSYYGSNPLSIAKSNVTLGVMPAQFGDGVQLENYTMEEPLLHPRETVDTLLRQIAPDVAGKRVTALLQAYTATGYKYNRPYTAEDISEQINALSGNGVESYILYSPDGKYPQ